MSKGIIICGFAGIGKSYLAHNSNWVDLESTPFNKNWDLYSNVAIHMSNNGYNVMLSCHEEIRKALKNKHVGYCVVIPTVDCKKEYINRYINRGNDDNFIRLFDREFENFINQILYSEKIVYQLGNNQYLKDIIDIIQPTPTKQEEK